MGWMAAGAMLAALMGFAAFLACVPRNEITLTRKADGIVVLTGGSSRVSDAMELLAAGHAQRLLISGVHPQSGTGDLSRVLPEHQRLLACCVDLDHFARNTRGNASEARRWAQTRGFRSLIVVTSNYHMPRAITEFAHAMPDVALTPFPVVGERWKSEPWWSSSATLRLVLFEYVKYIFAELRLALQGLGVITLRDVAVLPTLHSPLRERPQRAALSP